MRVKWASITTSSACMPLGQLRRSEVQHVETLRKPFPFGLESPYIPLGTVVPNIVPYYCTTVVLAGLQRYSQ